MKEKGMVKFIITDIFLTIFPNCLLHTLDGLDYSYVISGHIVRNTYVFQIIGFGRF